MCPLLSTEVTAVIIVFIWYFIGSQGLSQYTVVLRPKFTWAVINCTDELYSLHLVFSFSDGNTSYGKSWNFLF